MKERVSILIGLLPDYGSILMGVASIALSGKDRLLDNMVAREKLTQYLLQNALRKKRIAAVCSDESFQEIIYEYTGSIANVAIIGDNRKKYEQVNILMADFFHSVIWPIIIPKYMESIDRDVNGVTVSINIKKNVILTIYDCDDSDLFFKEFKEFLLYNNIIISEAIKKEDGNLFVKLLIPLPPYSNM